jgi:hypothetical protein
MRRSVSIIFGSLAFGTAALVCDIGGSLRAQQSNTSTFTQTFESAFAQARAECTTLWSDHIFDPLRSKIPLGEEKPTFSMLTNTAKLPPKEKPLADSAIKTLEKMQGRMGSRLFHAPAAGQYVDPRCSAGAGR